MIDLHSHPLPALDDGPATDAGALALARAAVADGTRRLAATPHIDRHIDVAVDAIGPALARLRGLLAAEGVPLELENGGEISLDRLVGLSDVEVRSLGLGGGPYVLVECPLSNRPGEFEWPARALLERGVGVLLAHPERCPGFQRDLRRVSALVQRGALVQLTAGSIRGDFGAPARNAAFELARFGLVHDLASDAHDAVHRPPGLSAARAALAGVLKGGDAEAIWLTEDAPAAILAGRRPTGRPTASDPAASGRY